MFAVLASISSRIAEGIQSELLEDSRIASTYASLWDTAAQEMRWVIDLPMWVWSALASVAQSSPEQIQDEAIAASHISFHFLWRRVLQPASELPWRLFRGDIESNLEAMKAGPQPEEPCSSQLWELMHDHPLFPRSNLVGVVELLGQVSWSSLPAEQQHGSLAALHRWHPEYELDTLVSRALCHQMVRLLPSASDLDKKISRIARQLRKLDSKVPERARGQHMLLKALMAVARGRKDAVALKLDERLSSAFASSRW